MSARAPTTIWASSRAEGNGKQMPPDHRRRHFCATMEEEMGLAQYAIVPLRDQWGVLHDGDVNSEYATKEAAFEAAVSAASLAMRQGHEVHVSVPARNEATDSTN